MSSNSENYNKISATNDLTALLVLYSEAAKSTQFVVDKIWSNAKFFTTITSALLTVTIGALAKIFVEPDIQENTNAYLVILIIPIIIIVIGKIGTLNLKREYERFLNWITVRAKIQERLGLCDEFSSNLFPEDRYLLPLKFVETNHQNSESFVESNMNTKGSLYHHFKNLHLMYTILAISLMGFIIVRLILIN